MGRWRVMNEHTAEKDMGRIEDLIERSSLGTPEAKALRATVSDEHAARIVARARELAQDFPHEESVERTCGLRGCPQRTHVYVLEGDWFRCVLPPASTTRDTG